MTESCGKISMSILTPSAAALPPAARLAQVCSSGFPAAGVEVVLRDSNGATVDAPPPPPPVPCGSTPLPLVVSRVGEVHIRGPTVFGGYTRRGAAASSSASLEAFTPDGFLRTGDLATWDGLRYLRVVGRCVCKKIHSHAILFVLISLLARIPATPRGVTASRTWC